MALREFEDTDGRRWQVWLTAPAERPAPQYSGAERRGSGDPENAPVLERRGPNGLRRILAPGIDGWLSFETQGEKRRLAPVPPDWSVCSKQKLIAYWREAAVVPRQPSSPEPRKAAGS